MTCEAPHGVCSKCYGADLTTGHFIDIGEAVGIIGAQSIGEPGTQLTMRTFHTGGTVTAGDFQFQSRIEARHDGRVKYEKIEVVERKAPDSEVTERVVLSRNGQLLIVDENGRVVERHQVPIGATLCVEDGAMATKGNSDTNDPPPTLLLERDPYRVPILTEHNGVVVFQDIIEGHTVQEDKASGLAERVIVEYKGEDQPRMEIRTPDDDVLASYLMPTGAHLSVTDGEEVEAGTVLARLPEKSATSQDIVTGLPRVTELLEARRPKDRAIIAEIEGYVEFDHRISRGMRQLRIKHGDESSALYRIPIGKHLVVHENDWVDAGDRLTDGFLDPHDILKVKGEEEVQSYLVNEVQDVYRSQGEHINDKHIEVIVRQMLNKVKILSAGDTEFLEEDEVDRSVFHRINRRIENDGGQPAIADPILQGVTKAALSTESFISAASFQQTTNVLTKASVVGQKDYLKGLKENVIMGRLIPAGSGVPSFRKIEVYPETEELPGTEDALLPSADEEGQAAD